MNSPAPTVHTSGKFDIIPIAAIAPSTTRTQVLRRSRFDKVKLEELAANLKTTGLMQPIVVRPHPKPTGAVKFEIVAGERRWRAADMAGLIEISAMVRSIADPDLIQFQLTENIQRETLDELEEAEGYSELRTLKKITADDIAVMIGKSRAHVFDRLKLLALAPEARTLLSEGKLNASVALMVARIPDPLLQAKAAKGCVTGKSSDLMKGFQHEFGDGPLTVQDAKKYIDEGFMLRVEGTAAINQAKAAGKSVIAGKEAADIWKHSFGGPAGYIRLTDNYWSGNQRKTYSAALGDNPPQVILIQNPHTGEAVKCLLRADVIKLFTEKKLKLPEELSPQRTFAALSSSTKAKAEEAKERAKKQREAEKERLEADILVAVFKAMRQKTPAKLGKEELIELIWLAQDYSGGDLDPSLAPRPKSLIGCTERELVRFVIDELYGQDLGDIYSNDGRALCAAAKRYGVNVEKIRKEITADAQAKLKAKATPATAKKSAKPGKR